MVHNDCDGGQCVACHEAERLGGRKKPPERCVSINVRLQWGQMRFQITKQYEPNTGALCAVFYADGQKSGTDLQHTIVDACILISMLLQCGMVPDQIGKSMSFVPDALGGDGVAGSIIGVIVDELSADPVLEVVEVGDILGGGEDKRG